MNVLLLLARLLLAALFAIAAAAKLRNPAGSRKAVGDFGLPPLLAGPAAFLLPFAELGVAVARSYPRLRPGMALLARSP